MGSLTGYSSCALPDNLSVSVTTANQISGYTYDAAGNLTAIPGTGGATYTYNAESEMTTSTTSTASATYTYDGDGKRAKKSGAMVYWYGMTSAPLEETAPAGALQNDYIFFGGERIARLDATGDIFGYFADHLGSSRKMREIASGATTSTAAYDADFYPFGREHVFTSGSPIYKFTGKIRDTDTGLDDFGARYYSFTIGRFMSADWSAVPVPVPYANLTNPQTLNLYAMVSDNPETFNDLDGHGCGLSLSGSGDISCENTYTVGGVTGENSGTRSPQTTGDGQPPSDSQAEANEISNQQNQAQQQNSSTPAPTNPDGTPAKPPTPPPPGADGKPNDWVRTPGKNGKPDQWDPRDTVPNPKGGQPRARWDEKNGHWDIDDGNRNRTRYLPNGTKVDHRNNPIPMQAVKGASWLVITYWIISEGSRLFPPRDLIPVP